MNPPIQAVFDSGVFRPLGPVDLAEGTRVEVWAPAVVDSPAEKHCDERHLSLPSASWPVFPTEPGCPPITAEMVQAALDGGIPEHLS